MVLTAAGCLAAAPALAVDGVVEVRSNHQEGRAGLEAYSTNTLWEVYTARQTAELARNLGLNLEFIGRRETLDGSSALSAFETERTTLSPLFNLSYHADKVRTNLFGRALRTDQTASGASAQRDDHLEGGLWFSVRGGQLNVDGNYREAAAWRKLDGDERETRDRQASLTARHKITPDDELMYRFSLTRQDAVATGTVTTHTTHQLRYRGDHRFADDRGTFSINAQRNQFSQRDEFDPTSALEFQLPVEGSYVLDDTPEFLDPLEPDPVPVPALFDGDLIAPTEINIGDDAPAVRDFGGDYRNIALDFGDLTEMGTAILYIDRRVRFPGLMTWSVRFSDDAEGRDWSLTPDGGYRMEYREWENGRQGWVLTLDTPVRHRRIKLVNVKLGATEPDIFVTEMEVYRPVTHTRPEVEEKVLRHQLAGTVRYNLSDRVASWYTTNLDRRDFDSGERDLRSAAHQVGAEAGLDGWILSGSYQVYTLRGPSRRDTDSSGQNVSLAQRRTGDFYSRFTWSRTVDDNYGADYTTNSLTGDATWRPAPALSINQKVSRGWREDPLMDVTASSWVLITIVRSYPRPSVQIDLRRTDRWVTREAGYGFMTFKESQADVRWAILPLLSYSGQAVYQERERDDWLLRNSLGWSPLPGGSVALNFYVNDYQDTRTDQLRRGGGAAVTWRPRSRLMVSGYVEKGYERLRGARSWPFSYQLRGYWTF